MMIINFLQDFGLVTEFGLNSLNLCPILNLITKLPLHNTISYSLDSFDNQIKQASNHITLSISRLFKQFPD